MPAPDRPMTLTSASQLREITFGEAAAERLETLWRGIHGRACPSEVRTLLSDLLGLWGSKSIPLAPHWPSDIGDDHSPFEFSVAFTGGGPEIRLALEAQGETPTFSATRAAALALTASLGTRGVDLQRFSQVSDLFLPEVGHARFALWHAVSMAPGLLRAKAYLNPQIRGVDAASAVVRSALERLGMPAAWSAIESALPGATLRGEAFRYFSLDLERSPGARVKVYLYPGGASVADLERIAALRPEYVDGEVTAFCRTLTNSTGPYGLFPMCVYLSFVGDDPVPDDVTVQLPLRHYTSDDRQARDRVRAYLGLRGLSTAVYDRALNAAAGRPLQQERGLHTYVSLRTGSDPVRLTAYFAAELYGSLAPISESVRISGSR